MIRLENNRRRPAHLAAAGARRQALVRDRSGGAIIWFALTMPIILGIWYMDKRILQKASRRRRGRSTASDSGAIAGAHVALQNGTDAEIRQAVEDEIARNDFAAKAGDVITVNIPPLSGPNAGTAGFVEVIITKPRPLYFPRFFRDQPTFIQSRAVSGTRSASENCVLALDRGMDAALVFDGTADADINCGVASNSRSASAVDMLGQAVVDVDAMQTHGDISISNNATLNSHTPPNPYSNYVKDPYADLDIPAASTCDETSQLIINGNATVTLDPGRYCGGIWITDGSDVTFNPGLYIIDGGDLKADGNSTLSGDGVTFILTADDPADIGTLSFSGGTEAQLSAPNLDGDPYAGVLVYQDRRAPIYEPTSAVAIKNKILGGAATDLQGAIYFPKQEVQYAGGAVGGDGCMQLIARRVRFSGKANILNSEFACDDMRDRKIEMLCVALIE